MEKTSKADENDDSDDEPDTTMHTDERITVDDIALSQSDKISEVI